MIPSALLEDAENAIKTLQGQDLKGRKLKLESAVKKARGKNAAKEAISVDVENTDVIIPSEELVVEKVKEKENKIQNSEKEGNDKKKKKLPESDSTADKKEETKKSEKSKEAEVTPKIEKIEKVKKVTTVVNDNKKIEKLKPIKNAEVAVNVAPVVAATTAPSSSLKLLILGNW